MANSDLIGSLVRAMEILKMIGGSPSGCRVEEICTAMQLKPPTVYNIIRTLTAGGFVERHNRSLRLGREFKRLAGVGEGGLLEGVAETELLALYQRIPKGTAIFGVSTRQGVEQTHRISFDRPGVIQNLPNEIMHPYATAAGLIGLAFAVFLYVLNNYIIGIRKGITQTELYQLETIVLMALSTCLILHRLGKPGNRD